MTGAYLKEIVMLSYMEGLETNDYSDKFTLNGSILIDKAKKISETRSKNNYYVKSDSSTDRMFD